MTQTTDGLTGVRDFFKYIIYPGKIQLLELKMACPHQERHASCMK